MYTICPGCCTLFQVTTAQLGKAGGLVHCGECDHVYSAVDYLFEELPAARRALSGQQPEAPHVQGTKRQGVSGEAAQWHASGEPGRFDDREAASSVLSPLGQPLLPRGWKQEGFGWKDIVNGAGVGLLLVLLGFQWLYFNRGELASELRWRPALERMCGVLGCELPLRVELGQLELLDRDVRQHPRVEDALLVNATFTNRSGFAQPYPVFEISFSDLAGTVVAVRRFQPAEYLADGVDIEAGIAPDGLVHVVLEVLDPGDEAASYQFGFF